MHETFTLHTRGFVPRGAPIPRGAKRLKFGVVVPVQLVGEVLTGIYKHELNVTLSSDWDGGYWFSDEPVTSGSFDSDRCGTAAKLGAAVGALGELLAAKYPEFRSWWDNFVAEHKLKREPIASAPQNPPEHLKKRKPRSRERRRQRS